MVIRPRRRCAASILSLVLVLGITDAATSNVAAHNTRLHTSLSTGATRRSEDEDDETKFSRLEQLEHNRVWRVIQKSCSGCWSGALRTYSVDRSKNKLVLKDNTSRLNTFPKKNPQLLGLLNFRLRVQMDGTVGTWSVWNLNRTGDHTVVPLRQIPLVRPTQLKIGFDEGIILRIPNELGSKLKRLVWEIGFWDPALMRRTTVVEYRRPSFWKSGWRLDDIVVIQMKPERLQHFVGNTTDLEATHVLPNVAPFCLSDCNLESYKVHRVESVDLQTMKRDTKAIATSSDRHSIKERITNAFNDDQYNGRKGTFITVLPNQMLVSLPTSIIGVGQNKSKNPIRAMFALCLKNHKLQVVELSYDAVATKAIAVSLYSLCQ